MTTTTHDVSYVDLDMKKKDADSDVHVRHDTEDDDDVDGYDDDHLYDERVQATEPCRCCLLEEMMPWVKITKIYHDD